MKIRHIATAALLICCYSTASAQVRIGLKAGLNMAQVSFSEDILDAWENEDTLFGLEYRMLPAFHVGIHAEFDFTSKFGMGIGLQMSGKGYRSGGELSINFPMKKDLTYSLKSTPLYLQAPIGLYFRSQHFFASAGGYIGLGLSGENKTKTKGDDAEITNEFELEFTNEYDPLIEDNPAANYSPLDYGASVELGYEIGRIRVSASYQVGLSNTFSKDYVDFVKRVSNMDIQGRHRVIGVSVAYLFGGGIE